MSDAPTPPTTVPLVAPDPRNRPEPPLLTHPPLGPHWWDEFHEPVSRVALARRSRERRALRGPRWAVIGFAVTLVALSLVLTYPSWPSLTGN